MVNVVYLAWVRERVGVSQETVNTKSKTVRDLIDELKSGSESHQSAFSDLKKLRFAVDHKLVDLDCSIVNANEVAIFPPMTGG